MVRSNYFLILYTENYYHKCDHLLDNSVSFFAGYFLSFFVYSYPLRTDRVILLTGEIPVIVIN